MAMTTKEKIFDVAVDLIAKNGFKATSIRQIASGVGIKESSIYNHYNNKDAILDDIIKYFMYSMGDTEGEVPDFDEVLDKYGIAGFYNVGSLAYQNKLKDPILLKIFRILFIEMYNNERIRDFILNYFIKGPVDGWVKIFDKCAEKNLIKKVDSKKLAKTYFYYGFYLIFENIVLKYPNYDYFKQDFFDDMEEHMMFILDLIKI